MKIKSSEGWAGGFEQGPVQIKTVKVMEAKSKILFFFFFKEGLKCHSQHWGATGHV